MAVLLNTIAVGALLVWKEIQGQDKALSTLSAQKGVLSDLRLWAWYRPINACLSIVALLKSLIALHDA